MLPSRVPTYISHDFLFMFSDTTAQQRKTTRKALNDTCVYASYESAYAFIAISQEEIRIPVKVRSTFNFHALAFACKPKIFWVTFK